MEMEEEPVRSLRETSRNLLMLNRRKHRDDVADYSRSVKNLRINPGTVLDIANKLKTKSAINLVDLQTLKNSLMDEASHADVVLNTPGALRGLVRELTGNVANKQVAAAGCLCNLSLGDSRSCAAISKAAGPYLVASLDNLTTELAITSAWTLGNLAGSGPKVCEILIAQGTVSKLTSLIDNNAEDISEASVYALVHFAYQLQDELRKEYLQKLFQNLPRLSIADTTHLLFVLSCHKDFTYRLISEDYLIRMLHFLHVNIDKPLETTNISYIFRTFANFHIETVYNIVLNYFFANKMDGSVRKLAENGNESVLWFLGNAIKVCKSKGLVQRLFD